MMVWVKDDNGSTACQCVAGPVQYISGSPPLLSQRARAPQSASLRASRRHPTTAWGGSHAQTRTAEGHDQYMNNGACGNHGPTPARSPSARTSDALPPAPSAPACEPSPWRRPGQRTDQAAGSNVGSSPAPIIAPFHRLATSGASRSVGASALWRMSQRMRAHGAATAAVWQSRAGLALAVESSMSRMW